MSSSPERQNMIKHNCLSTYKCKRTLPEDELEEDGFCPNCVDTYDKLQILNKIPDVVSNLIGEFLVPPSTCQCGNANTNEEHKTKTQYFQHYFGCEHVCNYCSTIACDAGIWDEESKITGTMLYVVQKIDYGIIYKFEDPDDEEEGNNLSFLVCDLHREKFRV